MGSGFKIRCKKCSYDFTAFLGIGMLFPSVYQNTVSEIKEGKYGEEYKKFFEENPNAAVNCERVFAVCGKCGKFDTVMDLSLYVPKKNDDSIQNIGYVMEEDLKSNFKKCKSYDHKCSCGGSMMITDLIGALVDRKVKCPKCSANMELTDELVMWD